MENYFEGERKDYFALKYCDQCYEILEGGFDGTCPVCGQKTAALNINKRLKFDGSIEKKDRNALKKAAAIAGAASVIHLGYSLIALLMLTGVIDGVLKKFAEDIPAFANGLGILIAAAFVLLSLVGITLSIGVLADMDYSVIALMWFLEKLAPSVIISVNLVSLGLYIYAFVYLDKLNARLGSDKLQIARMRNVHKAQNPVDKGDVWYCDNCGFINGNLDNECKSCGKYK